MSFAPKFATLAAVLIQSRLRRAFGGAARIVTGALVELVFSMLIVPVCAVSVTVFVLGLPFGKQVGWTHQLRDADGLPWKTAVKALWGHTAAGFGFAVWLWLVAPGALWIGAPFFVGLMLSIPMAVFTASARVGRWAGEVGLCLIPEETRRPERTEGTTLFAPFARDMALK
jgi:membrane glycosyltransferase